MSHRNSLQRAFDAWVEDGFPLDLPERALEGFGDPYLTPGDVIDGLWSCHEYLPVDVQIVVEDTIRWTRQRARKALWTYAEAVRALREERWG